MEHLKKGLRYMHTKTAVVGSEEFAKQNQRPDNTVRFAFQDGVIKEAGVNGVQVSDLLYFMYGTFASLNGDYPCEENVDTLRHLERAIEAQVRRTTNRTKRGIEGTNRA